MVCASIGCSDSYCLLYMGQDLSGGTCRTGANVGYGPEMAIRAVEPGGSRVPFPACLSPWLRVLCRVCLVCLVF
jgi:hypothetical protein